MVGPHFFYSVVQEVMCTGLSGVTSLERTEWMIYSSLVAAIIAITENPTLSSVPLVISENDKDQSSIG